ANVKSSVVEVVLVVVVADDALTAVVGWAVGVAWRVLEHPESRSRARLIAPTDPTFRIRARCAATFSTVNSSTDPAQQSCIRTG
ncbi:MAG TPA: hypothetical protein VMO88_14205, partial [Acidimicrobiales bacterium]|nr:hypothetical protein [Acidimicrobiales bacterium]